MGFWEPLFFWFFAFGALATSCAVLILRNPLYCALALIADFFFFAGLYVLLSAHFIAIVQILVYGGAIMVLFMFIIMLLNLSDDELGKSKFSLHHIVAILAGVAFFFMIGGALMTVFDDGNNDEAVSNVVIDEGDYYAAASAVPGLYIDLNEATVEKLYQEELQKIDNGLTNPATNKYRPFDPDQKYELPPAMKVSLEAANTPGATSASRYGSVEPFSILLVNRFVLPFQLTALLLLAAIVGAVIIAKRRVES